MSVGDRNPSYSKFSGLAQFPYQIITYLINNNENLWKLINYNDSNALYEAPLTKKQKGNLIYDGQSIATPYRMFMTDITDDMWSEQCAIVRIYEAMVVPIDRVKSIVNFEIDVLSHSKINQLNNYETRTSRMLEEILATLNGVDIGGIGYLGFEHFTDSKNDKAILNQANSQQSWSGYSIVMHGFVGTGSK